MRAFFQQIIGTHAANSCGPPRNIPVSRYATPPLLRKRNLVHLHATSVPAILTQPFTNGTEYEGYVLPIAGIEIQAPQISGFLLDDNRTATNVINAALVVST